MEIAVPRDRDASFELQLVKKRQRRLNGVENIVISLSAEGLTTEAAALLTTTTATEVSLVSRTLKTVYRERAVRLLADRSAMVVRSIRSRTNAP